jgi:hypothetical protein
MTQDSYKLYKHFPLQGLPKYSQIGFFGMQIYRVATLHVCSRRQEGVLFPICM